MSTRVRFVARLGARARRDREEAAAVIEAAATAGCTAVSVARARLGAEFAPEALAAAPRLAEHARAARLDLPPAELSALARAHGLELACAPGAPEEVPELCAHVDSFAIDSHQLPWSALLAAVARSGLPLTLGTGMATLEEVRQGVQTLRQNGCGPLTLLHGVEARPVPVEEANLAAIETLRRTFELPIGWADRTRDPAVVERAVRRFGATTVAFDLTCTARERDPVRRTSWYPGEIGWVLQELARSLPSALRQAHPADGDGRKEPRAIEAGARQWRTDPADGLRPMAVLRRRLARDPAA